MVSCFFLHHGLLLLRFIPLIYNSITDPVLLAISLDHASFSAESQNCWSGCPEHLEQYCKDQLLSIIFTWGSGWFKYGLNDKDEKRGTKTILVNTAYRRELRCKNSQTLFRLFVYKHEGGRLDFPDETLEKQHHSVMNRKNRLLSGPYNKTFIWQNEGA